MDRRWGRRRRIAVTAAVLAALFVPVALDRDGIPLSVYPMYSRTRGETVALVTANGLDADGDRVRLGLDTIGSSDDPLIVAGELRAALAAGRAEQRCDQIAGRVDVGDRDGAEVVAVEIVTERHDVVERTAGRDSLVDRAIHAQCEVTRT